MGAEVLWTLAAVATLSSALLKTSTAINTFSSTCKEARFIAIETGKLYLMEFSFQCALEVNRAKPRQPWLDSAYQVIHGGTVTVTDLLNMIEGPSSKAKMSVGRKVSWTLKRSELAL